jgi:hypothetical protein
MNIRVMKSKKTRLVAYSARMEERINVYIFVGKLEGKNPLVRSRHRWEDNIKIDFKGIECESVD